MFDATEELNNVHLYPKIRLFVAAQNTSATPLYDLTGVEEQWALPSKGIQLVVEGTRVMKTNCLKN